jgi:divalent metal cation (Fe/Co/Zn/Cd) transporter
MGRCIAALIAFAVPWFAGWVLVVIIAAGLVTGPIGWAILVAIAAFVISIALLWWAFNVCSASATRG